MTKLKLLPLLLLASCQAYTGGYDYSPYQDTRTQFYPSVDIMAPYQDYTGGWRPIISPVSPQNYPGSAINPIHVTIPTPSTGYAELP